MITDLGDGRADSQGGVSGVGAIGRRSLGNDKSQPIVLGRQARLTYYMIRIGHTGVKIICWSILASPGWPYYRLKRIVIRLPSLPGQEGHRDSVRVVLPHARRNSRYAVVVHCGLESEVGPRAVQVVGKLTDVGQHALAIIRGEVAPEDEIDVEVLDRKSTRLN